MYPAQVGSQSSAAGRTVRSLVEGSRRVEVVDMAMIRTDRTRHRAELRRAVAEELAARRRELVWAPRIPPGAGRGEFGRSLLTQRRLLAAAVAETRRAVALPTRAPQSSVDRAP